MDSSVDARRAYPGESIRPCAPVPGGRPEWRRQFERPGSNPLVVVLLIIGRGSHLENRVRPRGGLIAVRIFTRQHDIVPPAPLPRIQLNSAAYRAMAPRFGQLDSVGYEMLFSLMDYRRYRNRTGRFARDIRKSVMGGAFEGSLPAKAFEILQPGDMLLVQTLGSPLSWLVMYLTSSEISHAAFYLGNRKIAHATLSGVCVEPIDALLDPNTRILPGVLPIPANKRSEILLSIQGYVGLPYGWIPALFKGIRILSGRDWPYFRWKFFADISALLLLLDLPLLVAFHRPVITWVAPVYLGIVLANALRWRWKPLKFDGWTGKPCDLLGIVEGCAGSLMFDAYSLHQQTRAHNSDGTTIG